MSRLSANANYLRSIFKDFSKKIRLIPLPKQHTPANSTQILNAARINYAVATKASTADTPSFGKRWGSFQAEMAAKIARFGDVGDVIIHGQTKVNFDHRSPVTGKNLEWMAAAEHLLRYEFPEFSAYIDDLEDVTLSTPGTVVRRKVKGRYRLTSNIIYFHAMHILRALSFDRGISSVCEIGGGNGNVARLWLTNSISKIGTYCIVDIAESLFFSECFLRAALPDAEFVYVDRPDFDVPTQAPPSKQRVILCPVQCASALGKLSFDLLTNTGSLGEMTDEWVAYWGRWADNQNIRLFYSHNLFGNSIERIFEGRAICAPVMSSKWALRYVGATPALMKLQSWQRRTVELIFEKVEEERPRLSDFVAGLGGTMIGQHEIVRIVHGGWQGDDPECLLRLIGRIRDDLGYHPVESLHLVRRCLGWPMRREKAEALERELSALLEANYPKGVNAE